MRAPLPICVLAVLIVGAAGCFPPRDHAQLPEITDGIVAAAKQSAPEADANQLQHGRDTMQARCTQCHSMPAVDHESASEWPGTMKSMAKKAKLGADDETAMLRYVLAAEAVGPKG